MELIYAGLLIHKLGKKVDEATVKKVVEAAGGKADEGKIKALVSALENVNIEDLIKYFSKNILAEKPNLLIANTIKGKGFSFAESNNSWHHAVLTKAMYEKAKEELNNSNDY